MKANDDVKVNKEYKDRVFRLLFSDNNNLLSLCNALNNTNYTNVEELEVCTLDDVIYVKLKNDIAFMIDSTLNLYEHQSSFNPNMPFRGLLYFSDLLRQQYRDEKIYSSKLTKIPEPRYVVFYNGTKEMPDITELRLSDAYIVTTSNPCVEIVTKMVNINHGHNVELMEKCNILYQYSKFIDEVRTQICLQKTEIVDAIRTAIKNCIKDGVLSDFLCTHEKEVLDLSLTEFNEENYRKVLLEDGREEGREEGEEIGLEKCINITKLHLKGLSSTEIASKTGYPLETVERVIGKLTD